MVVGDGDAQAPRRGRVCLPDPAGRGENPRTSFLTIAQAAEELAVTQRFIRKLIAEGQLHAVKIGTRVIRIRRTDLEDLLRPARAVPHHGRR